MGVQRGVVPTGTRGQPAAQRRELEALGEVAKGEPGRTQLVLQVRPSCPALDPRRPARAVDLEHPVQPGHVERDHPGVVTAPVFHPTDHRAPRAVGHHGNSSVAGPVEHADHVVLGARVRHHVGGSGHVPIERTHHVAVRLAVGVTGTIGDGAGDDAAEGRRRDHTGPGQIEVREVRDRPGGIRQTRHERPVGRARIVGQRLVGPPPSPPRSGSAVVRVRHRRLRS